MTALPAAAQRRLLKLPRSSAVWEGDRRAMYEGLPSIQLANSDVEASDCILWVDGSAGTVRAMDVVDAETGPEAIVRVLLRAIESPHQPESPGLPQKIIVRDREVQFFLRGALQGLDINIDYAPNLPLIDALFESFQEAMTGDGQLSLPECYADALLEKAFQLWDAAIWEDLAEHEILAVDLNAWDLETVYLSVMGMLGLERGILIYRSLESLKRFRELAKDQEYSEESLQSAFLEQDCLFLSYDLPESEGDASGPPPPQDDIDLADIEPVLGSLHPLEGLRVPVSDEEGAVAVVVLEALHRFWNKHGQRFRDGFPAVTGRYRIAKPDAERGSLSVTVRSLPELARELATQPDWDDGEFSLPAFPEGTPLPLKPLPMRVYQTEVWVPNGAMVSIGMVSWTLVTMLRKTGKTESFGETAIEGEDLPIVLLQTSRPKAKALLEMFREDGGVAGLGFNPGVDPFGETYDLGFVRAGNGSLYMFGEYPQEGPVHKAARRKWDQRCEATQNRCGLLIAAGITGANRGDPQVKDMMLLFEADALGEADFGMGCLRAIPMP